MIFLKPHKLPYPVWLRRPFTLDSSSLSSLKHLMYLTRKSSLWHCTPAKIKHGGQLHMEHRKHQDSTAASKNPKPNPHSQKLLQKNSSSRETVWVSLPPAVLKARSVAGIAVPCLDSRISRDLAFQHPFESSVCSRALRLPQVSGNQGRTDGCGRGWGERTL